MSKFGQGYNAWPFAALVLVGIACGRPKGDSGVVIRQVLHGKEAMPTADAQAAAGMAPAQAAPAPGMSLGSTLVGDGPPALYRRAYERSRRQADGASARDRLAAMDANIDAEQGEDL